MVEIKKDIAALSRLLSSMLRDELLLETVNEISKVITGVYQSGNKTIFCGNGGSAAEAQHLAAELSGRFKIDRQPLISDACHLNPSFITAVSNDYSFSQAYARYVEGFCQKGDVLFGLSTSGNSENIIKAFEKAKNVEVVTIALTGETGGKLAKWADYLIKVPSTNVPRIQEVHLLIGHIICERVEYNLFNKSKKS